MIVIELRNKETITMKTEAVLKTEDHGIQIALKGDYNLFPDVEMEFRSTPRDRNPIIRQPDESGFVTVPRELFFGNTSGSIYITVVSWGKTKKAVARVEMPYIVKKEVDKKIHFKKLG